MNVVFVKPDKAFIGVEHGKAVNLTTEERKKAQDIADQHGLWYEGDGGDIVANKGIFGDKSAYDGSWDAKMARKIEGYPSEFLYTLFTNTKENQQLKHLTNPHKTIFASIMDAQDAIGYLKKRKFTDAVLRQFLKDCSSVGIDLLAMSQGKATSENVKHFLKAGERLMWPTDWAKYPNAAGKQAKKVLDQRIQFLKHAPSGVYIMGKDILKALA